MSLQALANAIGSGYLTMAGDYLLLGFLVMGCVGYMIVTDGIGRGGFFFLSILLLGLMVIIGSYTMPAAYYLLIIIAAILAGFAMNRLVSR